MLDLQERLQATLADRYTLERELGRGGMAMVYLARDLRHDRRVALKVMHPDLAASLGSERFLREIRIAAQLTHPHILPLHDSGEAQGFLYYAMPFVDGESLRELLIRERQLPIDECLRIARQVASALDYAHRHGFVHRDIKPENILLEDGEAVVADFGLARALTSAGGERLTQTGLAVGTPAYMSPEQAAGEGELDGRTDLYSLGCVLYEMLAGEPPFSGPTAQAMIARRFTEPVPSLRVIRDTVPAEVDGALRKALARLPADRFATAAQFGEALAGAGTVGAEAPAPRAQPKGKARLGRRALVWGLGGGLLLAGAAALLLVSVDRTPDIRFGRRIQLTLDPGLEIDPALSPDGRFVAYAAGTMPTLEIRVRQVDGGTAIPIAGQLGQPQRFPTWSPDGQRIMFRSPRGIEIVSSLGGTARLLVPEQPARAAGGQADPWRSIGVLMPAGWSPDGAEISFVRSDSLYALALAGGAPRLLAHGGEMHSCAWSPDGGWIACVRGNRQSQQPSFLFGNRGQASIWLIPAARGAPVPITDDRSYHASPVWVPGSRALLFLSNREGGLDVYRIALRRSGAPEGVPARITTGLNAQAISLAADGRRLAYSVFTETSNVWSLPIPSGAPASVRQAEPVTAGNQVIEGFDLSPEGGWLAFDSDRSGNQDIYRQPLAGREPEQLTADPTEDFWPRWSPNGEEIAFHAFRDGRRHLFVMAADGRERRQVTDGTEDERTASWSADGRTLFYLRNFNGPDSEVRRISREQAGGWTRPRTVFRGNAWPVDVSPNDRLLAFASGGAVWTMSPTGDSARILVPSSNLASDPQPAYVSWSADGRALYYLAVDAADRASIWSVSRSGGSPRLMVRFDDPTREWHRFGFTAHGGRFFFTLGDRQSDIWATEVEAPR